jgi:3-oxoacyl-[acyl-carrier-protein] synthase III
MGEYGNTVSSSIPIALLRSKNKIKKNKPILIMGFGVGYSLCGGIYKFD